MAERGLMELVEETIVQSVISVDEHLDEQIAELLVLMVKILI